MVYQKSGIKVLLGPEKYQDYFDSANDAVDQENEQFRVQNSARRREAQGFDKIGESNVYKRTRTFQPPPTRPKLERYPSGLELSGQRVNNKDDNKTVKPASDLDKSLKDVETLKGEETPLKLASGRESTATNRMERNLTSADSRQTPTYTRRRERSRYSAGTMMSNNFLTEFGLRSERTDTFSGHQRRRGTSAAGELERQLEMSAERHIRTCQVVGNVKRSSRAQMSYQGLKDTVSPMMSPHGGHSRASTERLRRTTPLGYQKDKTFHGVNQNLDSNDSVVPYLIQIRKNIGSMARMKALTASPRHDSLQQINSRTMIVGSGMNVS